MMIGLKILLGFVGAAIVTTLLDKFYDEFAKWLKTIPKIVEKAIDGILIGVKAFIDMTKRYIGTEISKSYSLNNNQWQLTTITRDIPVNEIPNEILSKAHSGKLEVTKELDLMIRGG